MPPVPSTQHQETLRDLGFLLYQFVRTHQLGEIFFAPFDVVLDNKTIVQPDIVSITKEKYHILTQCGCEGVPDLVVEIISPATFYRDSEKKICSLRKGGYSRISVN